MCVICEIKQRAYLIWQREDCPDGRALDNWLQAEQEVIQFHAYFLWEQQGRPEGRALDNWLEAERNVSDCIRRARESERILREVDRVRDALRCLVDVLTAPAGAGTSFECLGVIGIEDGVAGVSSEQPDGVVGIGIARRGRTA